MDIYLDGASAEDIKNRLLWMFEMRGWTQKQVADALHLTKGSYWKILNGKRGMSIDFIVKHCRLLNESLSFVLVGDESLNITHEYRNDEDELRWHMEQMLAIAIRMDDKTKYAATAELLSQYLHRIYKDDLTI